MQDFSHRHWDLSTEFHKWPGYINDKHYILWQEYRTVSLDTIKSP